MADPEPFLDDADVARESRRIAAGLLVAIVVATIVMIAAGQAFAADEGCGEPGSGHAERPVAFAVDRRADS
jgi:hypothetical protein